MAARLQHGLLVYDVVLSRRYTAAAIWIRLRVTQPAGSETLVLRMGLVYLDDIRMFDPLSDTGLPRKSGYTTCFDESNEFNSLAHKFVIPAGQEPRTAEGRLLVLNSYSRKIGQYNCTKVSTWRCDLRNE